MRIKSQKNKTSNLPNGVYRFIEYDKRLKNPVGKVGFGCLIYVDKVKRTEKFRVNKFRTEEEAKNLACDLRALYEFCIVIGSFTEYNFEIWKNNPVF